MQQTFLQRSSFDSWPIAKPLHRSIAFLIDCVIVLLLVVGVMKIFKLPILWQNTPFFWLITMWFWDAFFGIFTGTSPGKRVLSLEIYSPRYDGPPSPVQVAVRVVMFWVSLALLAIGILPILSRRDHRGWHDLVAETLVIGTARSSPSALAMKWIPDVILVLSLLLFSGIGARIFSTGLKNSKPATYSLKNCDSPEALVKSPEKTLTALVISPALTNCWQAIETTNQSIRDSHLFQLAQIAKNYHRWLMINESARPSFYAESIAPLEKNLCAEPSKECSSARYLADIRKGDDVVYSENYFSDASEVLKNLFSLKNEEIGPAVAEATKTQEDPWLKLLLLEMYVGINPNILSKTNFSSNNSDWIQATYCLYRLNNGLSTNNCNRIEEAFKAVIEAEKGNIDLIDDYLADQPRDFIYDEIRDLKNYFEAKGQNDLQKMAKFRASYPADALFYHNVKN